MIKREKSFVLGFWNYNDSMTGGASEVQRWADLGMTVAMAPRFKNEADIEANLPPLLDEMQRHGMKLILQFGDTYEGAIHAGADKYREAFKARYEKYGKHPAVLGFFSGEEPSKNNMESFSEVLRIQREVAPELVPFVDLGANDECTRYICDHANITNCGFGNYSQMEPEERGTDDYFRIMNHQMSICKEKGMDCWATLLSSAHYRFRAPNEDDYRWQINSAAACGCTGIIWFRLYDKLVAMDYRGSPINEFGENSLHYYEMQRVQKRFNLHHAELLMKLQYQQAYFLVKRYGGYPAFPDYTHPIIRRAYCSDTFLGYYDKDTTPGIVSFFKDEQGVEYVAVVNNNPYVPNSITLEFSPEMKSAEYIYYNGKEARKISKNSDNNINGVGNLCEEIWLAPGQMEIIRIS